MQVPKAICLLYRGQDHDPIWFRPAIPKLENIDRLLNTSGNTTKLEYISGSVLKSLV